jgi:hypothetical protein
MTIREANCRCGASPGMISVPVGGLADSDFPEPRFSLYEERQHDRVQIATQELIDRMF